MNKEISPQDIDLLLNRRINFNQDQPRLGNQFTEDECMQKYLPLFLEGGIWQDSQQKDLQSFGGKVSSRAYLDAAYNAEVNKPYLETHDAWGRRIDRLVTSEGWKFLKREAGVERLIALAYQEDDQIKNKRFHQAIKLFLFSQSSALVSCPLAMTDGAAFVIRELQRGDSRYYGKELEEAYNRLTSTDPGRFWTSGQWMTEKKGGSDVTGGTETFAIEKKSSSNNSPKARREQSVCSLYGYKWFSSATDADMSLALCRFPSNQKELELNTGRLGLVFLKMRDSEGNLNNIEVIRLKDKMGTRQLPTAELLLKGTKGLRISEVGQGVKQISSMLNVTRVHNSISAVSGQKRILALANDYAKRRFAFGSLIEKKLLWVNTMNELELKYRGNFLFVLQMVQFLQEIDQQQDKNKEIFRISTSALKVFTAKETVSTISEGLECFGGLGYMENSKIPIIYRDNQVCTIWEGTTNILSLDFAKTVAKDFNKFSNIFQEFASQINPLKESDNKNFEVVQTLVQQYLEKWKQIIENPAKIAVEANARTLTFNYACLFILVVICSKVTTKFLQDETENALLQYWIQRTQQCNSQILGENEIKNQIALYQKITSKSNFGKDHDAFGTIRSRL